MAALYKKLDILRAHKAYELVPMMSIPQGQYLVGDKLSAGVQYQGGRLVQGARSRVGVGASERARLPEVAFTPACKIQRVRMVLATAAEKVWALWQLDVQTTFIYAHVEEKVILGHEAENEAAGAPMPS